MRVNRKLTEIVSAANVLINGRRHVRNGYFVIYLNLIVDYSNNRIKYKFNITVTISHVHRGPKCQTILN